MKAISARSHFEKMDLARSPLVGRLATGVRKKRLNILVLSAVTLEMLLGLDQFRHFELPQSGFHNACEHLSPYLTIHSARRSSQAMLFYSCIGHMLCIAKAYPCTCTLRALHCCLIL